MQEFQLRILPLKDNDFALELYQCTYKKAGEKKRPAAKRIGRVKGHSLVLIRQAVYQTLKANNYDPKTLSYKRSTPYILSEESGVNLAILFQAVQPLRKESKIVNIRDGIMAMSNEEAHYWFAKISNGKRSPALKAMRVLLGES
ncbi:hypothetical protein [Cyanothece sp. BG0011]|uniref:DUF7680 family protein n=1 Tax=Cyanothece sp. BG0011 TaxID=2082950 RepID=UPI000D1DF842|nr:hypothetical protein [Cyanothece sp. BG0011]